MKKMARYCILMIMFFVVGCAMTTGNIEYPKDWSPLVKTTDMKCYHIAGTYKNVSSNQISGPTRTYDYKLSVSQELYGIKAGNIELVEIILHGDEYVEVLFFEKDGQTYKYQEKVKYICDNGVMTVRDHEFLDIFEQGYLGVERSRIDLHRNLNRDLVLHEQNNFVGLFFFIPLAMSNDTWFRCAPLEVKGRQP